MLVPQRTGASLKPNYPAKNKFQGYVLTFVIAFLSGGYVGRYEIPHIDPKILAEAKGCAIDGEHIISRVIDGDTPAILLCGREEKIRLIGINTPEIHDTHTGVQCFGPEASEEARRLLLNTKVRIETDPSQGKTLRDMHGRLLAYVWLPNGKNFGEHMLAEGFAHEELYKTTYKYRQAFVAAEIKARAENKGMWGSSKLGCAEESEKTTVRMNERPHKKATLQ